MLLSVVAVMLTSPGTNFKPPPGRDRPRIRRLLIIRPSALGDVCRSVPILASLRCGYPEAEIDWLVQDAFVPAIAAHPALTRAIPFPRRELSAWGRPRTWPAIAAFLRSLREAKYDLVVDAQGLARSGLFAAATRAPRRVGLSDARELGWLGLTELVHTPRDLHTVDRMMLIAQAAGGLLGPDGAPDMRLYSAPGDRDWTLQQVGSKVRGRYVVIAPTTRWPAKLWPAERHLEVARHLLQNAPEVDTVAVVGGGGDAERAQAAALCAASRAEPRIVDLVGRTSVGQLMAVIEHAALVIASDSAALHMAVGFGRPIVALFGPTNVSRVGPYRQEDSVIQHVGADERLDHKDAAAGAAIMSRISVDEVVHRATMELRRGRGLTTTAVSPHIRASASPV